MLTIVAGKDDVQVWLAAMIDQGGQKIDSHASSVGRPCFSHGGRHVCQIHHISGWQHALHTAHKIACQRLLIVILSLFAASQSGIQIILTHAARSVCKVEPYACTAKLMRNTTICCWNR